MKKFYFEHRVKFIVLIGFFLVYWFWRTPKLFEVTYSTVLLDKNGELLSAQIASDGQWRFPELDSTPVKVEKCIVYFEDEYFYYHPGFNPASIFNSILRNLKAGKIKSGGSTITMQLARMALGNNPRSYLQKLYELFFAIRIELSKSKSNILKSYLSHAPYGGNVVGLNAASWRYFGRSPHKLSWAESALLAVLPNAPSLIYPGKNPSTLLKKRNKLLKKLLMNKIIDERTYQLSLQEDLPIKPFPLPQLANHLLQRSKIENRHVSIIKSTLQKDLQIQVSDLLNKHMAQLSMNHIHNAGVVVAEVESGNVLAYVGNSFSDKNIHENYVDVVNAPRSTGSILKPFLYAFMLNENKILPNSLIEDVPTQIGSYGPKNFNLNYDGLVPVDKALARSLNVPAVKMLLEYGTPKFHQRLKQVGFNTFNKPSSHYGLSLILGGGEATLWEVASAYASMGRALNSYSNTLRKYNGNNYKSLEYLIKNSNMKKVNTVKTDLLNASSLWFTFNAMTELIRPQDYVGWMQFLSKTKIAWKTGTSYGFRDAWAVGLDAKYIVAVWVGNADGEGRPELTGTTAAAPLLFSVFNVLNENKWFIAPENDFEKIKVCNESGYKASEICDKVSYKFVNKGASKSQVCIFHKLVHLDETGKFRVNSDCYPVSKMKTIPWFIATPSQEYFYKQHVISYKSLPDYLPECEVTNSYRNLEIIYPKENFKIYLPLNESGKRETCVLKATHKAKNAELFWSLDDKFIGTTKNTHQISFVLSIGKHSLMISDQNGEQSEVKFEVVGK